MITTLSDTQKRDQIMTDTFEKHQLRIAKDTLRMSDAGALILGGMDKAEARAFLRDTMNWSEARVAKLEAE